MPLDEFPITNFDNASIERYRFTPKDWTQKEFSGLSFTNFLISSLIIRPPLSEFDSVKKQNASSNSDNDDNGDINGNEDFTTLELTCLNGINMSKNAELEYRISLHSLVMVILKEQETAVINTNIQIKNMAEFCMYLVENEDDSFWKEFKLIKNYFISPNFEGRLQVVIKNTGAYTKILNPSNIIGYFIVRPFLQDSTCLPSYTL